MKFSTYIFLFLIAFVFNSIENSVQLSDNTSKVFYTKGSSFQKQAERYVHSPATIFFETDTDDDEIVGYSSIYLNNEKEYCIAQLRCNCDKLNISRYIASYFELDIPPPFSYL